MTRPKEAFETGAPTRQIFRFNLKNHDERSRPELTAPPPPSPGHEKRSQGSSNKGLYHVPDIISCHRHPSCSKWPTRSVPRTSWEWHTGTGYADVPQYDGTCQPWDTTSHLWAGITVFQLSEQEVSTWGIPWKEGGAGEGRGMGVIGTHLDCPENPNESCACNRSPHGTLLSWEDVLQMPRVSPVAGNEALGAADLSLGKLFVTGHLGQKKTHTHIRPWVTQAPDRCHAAAPVGFSMSHVSLKLQVSASPLGISQEVGPTAVFSTVKLNLLGYICEVINGQSIYIFIYFYQWGISYRSWLLQSALMFL